MLVGGSFLKEKTKSTKGTFCGNFWEKWPKKAIKVIFWEISVVVLKFFFKYLFRAGWV